MITCPETYLVCTYIITSFPVLLYSCYLVLADVRSTGAAIKWLHCNLALYNHLVRYE